MNRRGFLGGLGALALATSLRWIPDTTPPVRLEPKNGPKDPPKKVPVLMKGDIITISGVFALNPLTNQSTGRLQQFVVTADDGSLFPQPPPHAQGALKYWIQT